MVFLQFSWANRNWNNLRRRKKLSYVKCSEEGLYMPWNLNCIKRFSDLEQAIQYLEETKPKPSDDNLSGKEFLEIVKSKFPTEFGKN